MLYIAWNGLPRLTHCFGSVSVNLTKLGLMDDAIKANQVFVVSEVELDYSQLPDVLNDFFVMD